MAFAPPDVEFAVALSSLVKVAVPALALALLSGCDRESGREAQPSAQADAGGGAPAGKVDRSHKGEPLPDLAFRDAGGRTLKLRSLTGKPLLINLWATWCAPCVAELPTLNALAAREAGKLRVLTVSEDLNGAGPVAEFLKGKGLDRLEGWLDPENEATVRYGVATLPVTIHYDAQGRELWRIAGGHDWGSAETAALLAE
jgi:thiol-disulfide isomerase/thioredoxin